MRISVDCVQVALAQEWYVPYLVDVFILDEYLTPKERKKTKRDGGWGKENKRLVDLRRRDK